MPLHVFGVDDSTTKSALHLLVVVRASPLRLVRILWLHHRQLSKHKHFRQKKLRDLAQLSEIGRQHMLGWLTSIITGGRMITYMSLAELCTLGYLEVIRSLF